MKNDSRWRSNTISYASGFLSRLMELFCASLTGNIIPLINMCPRLIDFVLYIIILWDNLPQRGLSGYWTARSAYNYQDDLVIIWPSIYLTAGDCEIYLCQKHDCRFEHIWGNVSKLGWKNNASNTKAQEEPRHENYDSGQMLIIVIHDSHVVPPTGAFGKTGRRAFVDFQSKLRYILSSTIEWID